MIRSRLKSKTVVVDPRIVEVEDAVRRKEDDLAEARKTRDIVIAKVANERLRSAYLFWQLHKGRSDCPTSPTTTCLYNGTVDPHHDSCLFCEKSEAD